MNVMVLRPLTGIAPKGMCGLWVGAEIPLYGEEEHRYIVRIPDALAALEANCSNRYPNISLFGLAWWRRWAKTTPHQVLLFPTQHYVVVAEQPADIVSQILGPRHGTVVDLSQYRG